MAVRLRMSLKKWSTEVTDRADNVFKGDTKDGPIKDREKRIKKWMK